MVEKLKKILTTLCALRLFVLLAALKSSQFAIGLYRGSSAWVSRGLIVLLFFGVYLIAELGPMHQGGKAARRMRAGLLVLLVVALTWDALRATDAIVTNRMEHERLLQIHHQMKNAEKKSLQPIYQGYQRRLRYLRCRQSLVALNHRECAELDQRRAEISGFLLRRPEPSNDTSELRATLRARQARLWELLLGSPVTWRSQLDTAELPLYARCYSYWEIAEWIGRNPYKIEVQAMYAKLLRNALLLINSLILAAYLHCQVLDHPQLPKQQPLPTQPLIPLDWREASAKRSSTGLAAALDRDSLW